MRERGELRPDATSELFWVSLAQGKAREALGWVDDPFMPEEPKGRMLQCARRARCPGPWCAARCRAHPRRGRQCGCRPALLRRLLRGEPGTMAGAAEVCWSGCRPARSVSARRGIRPRPASPRRCGRHSKDTRAWRRGQRDRRPATARALATRGPSGQLAAGDRQYPPPLVAWPAAHGDGAATGGAAVLRVLDRHLRLPTDYERGRIYEQLGEVERAREAYALFLAPRQQADPVFQPMIQDARAALQRLAVATTE